MTAVVELIAPGGIVTDVSDRVRKPTSGVPGFALTMMAEGGAVGSSDIRIEDGDATLTVDVVRGLNTLYVYDSDSEADDPTIYRGGLGNRDVERGPYETGASRHWVASLHDVNTGLSRFIVLPGEHGDRPEETDEERITWLQSLDIGQLHFSSTTYLDFSDPVTMSETDLTGRTYQEVLDDCARQSGKNYFLWFDGAPGGEGICLVYIPEDSTELTTDLRLSNDLGDLTLDASGYVIGDTFPYSDETKLTFDVSRVASHVLATGDGVQAVAASAETATEFSIRHVTMDEPDVRSASVLKARATRYVRTLGTEEETITGTVELPAEKASQFRAGHRLQVKGTHLPGYEDFVWMRLTEVTHEMIGAGDLYRVRFVAMRPTIPPPSPPLYGILRGPGGPFQTENGSNLVHWGHVGDAPGPGYDVRPTTGLITALVDASPPQSDKTFYGWQIDGDGTIDVVFRASIVGIIEGIDVFITWAIVLNGAVVEQTTHNHPSGLRAVTDEEEVTAVGVVVADGDIITARLTSSIAKNFMTPAGVGNLDERLEITGGSLS